jgi:predicted negative regulator of RcsB-dependent stress response
VLLDEKAYDEALKQLESAHAPAFDARFAELKGDVLSAQGKKAEAKAAYQAAIAKLASQGGEMAEKNGSPYRQLLEQKLDSLGADA